MRSKLVKFVFVLSFALAVYLIASTSLPVTFMQSAEAQNGSYQIVYLTSDAGSPLAQLQARSSVGARLSNVQELNSAINTFPDAVVFDNTVAATLAGTSLPQLYRQGVVIGAFNVSANEFRSLVGLPCRFVSEGTGNFYFLASRLLLAANPADAAAIETAEQQTCDGGNAQNVLGYAIYTGGTSGSTFNVDSDYALFEQELRSHIDEIRGARATFATASVNAVSQ